MQSWRTQPRKCVVIEVQGELQCCVIKTSNEDGNMYSQSAENQGNIHTVCSGHYRRLGEEGLIIVLCLFSTNSLLNLDIRNTVGNWDLDIYVDQQTEEIPGVLQKRMWSLVLLGDKGRRSSCPQQIQPGSRYRQP